MKTTSKFLILLFLSVIGFSSCSKDDDASQTEQPKTYSNSMSFGQDNYGIQLVYVKQEGTLNKLNLYLSSLSKQQIKSLPEGSGAAMHFRYIPTAGNGFYVELPTSHFYLAEVNSSKLLRSNSVESKKATEGHIEVLEYTEDSIKLKYSYTRKDGVVFKGEYNGSYESNL